MNPPRGRVSDEEDNRRRHARFKVEVDVTIRSKRLGAIPGFSIDRNKMSPIVTNLGFPLA
jgi:hypothetical protein